MFYERRKKTNSNAKLLQVKQHNKNDKICNYETGLWKVCSPPHHRRHSETGHMNSTKCVEKKLVKKMEPSGVRPLLLVFILSDVWTIGFV